MTRKVKGPADGILVAAFNGKAKAHLIKSNITMPSTLVLLSIVGNEQCQGVYLEAITEQALKTGNPTIFLVADLLYWHNLKGLRNTPEEIHALEAQAISMGSKYIEDNLPFILNAFEKNVIGFKSQSFYEKHPNASASELIDALNQLAIENNIPFEITRWEQWVSGDNSIFTDDQSHLLNLYETEPELINGIEATKSAFVKRLKNRPVDTSDAALYLAKTTEDRIALINKRSHDYLCEESLEIYYKAAKLGINYIAYPGDEMEAFHATKSFFISSTQYNICPMNQRPETIVNWIHIDFGRKKQNAVEKINPNLNILSKPAGILNLQRKDDIKLMRSRSCDQPFTQAAQRANSLFFRPVEKKPRVTEQVHQPNIKIEQILSQLNELNHLVDSVIDIQYTDQILRELMHLTQRLTNDREISLKQNSPPPPQNFFAF